MAKHLLCVQPNPTFEIALEENENIFSMLNIGIKGVALGAPWSSCNCYDLFQSHLIDLDKFMLGSKRTARAPLDAAVHGKGSLTIRAMGLAH